MSALQHHASKESTSGINDVQSRHGLLSLEWCSAISQINADLTHSYRVFRLTIILYHTYDLELPKESMSQSEATGVTAAEVYYCDTPLFLGDGGRNHSTEP